MSSADNLERFVAGYAECMIWANARGEYDIEAQAEPHWWASPAADWAVSAFDADSQLSMRADCRDFVLANLRDLMAYVRTYAPTGGYNVWECAGHDFALTRNRHGAGFWDRGLGDLGDRLADAARVYGESGAYFDDRDGTYDTELHLESL